MIQLGPLGETRTKEMWDHFAESVGPKVLQAAYGDHWPRPKLSWELVFEFRGGAGEQYGWGSLIYDPTELVTWHTHGVFPQFKGQEISAQITRALRATAFRATPCIALCCKILDTNPRGQRWMREENPNKGWVPAGRIALPAPGYDVYSFSRDYWEQNEQGRV